MNYIQQHNQVQEWHNLLSGYVLPGIVYEVNMLPDNVNAKDIIKEWFRNPGPILYDHNDQELYNKVKKDAIQKVVDSISVPPIKNPHPALPDGGKFHK